MKYSSNFKTVLRHCNGLNESTDIGNNGLDISGRSAEEVADALSTMALAIGTLEMLITNLLNRVEISLPEKELAGEAALRLSERDKAGTK